MSRNRTISMMSDDQPSRIVYKLVLTGGPCGGKTTGQTRLSTFFENLGWEVFRVPETATILMSGGIKFSDLTPEQADRFQCNLIKTMMQIEQTYFELAESSNKNCLIICDRGVMDPSAYMPTEAWLDLISKSHWNNIDLRDGRYNQVIHMTTAAKGAEEFYTTDEHVVRSEGPELACRLDDKVAQAWVGHPYYDVIDNSTNFESKVKRMIGCVCSKLGIDVADRLSLNSKKRKYLIIGAVPDASWPAFEEFDVVHDYLVTQNTKSQARIRKRGQNGVYTFTHTVRRPKIQGQRVELRKQVSGRIYQMLLAQRDDKHYTIFKRRRCFLWKNRYFTFDIYQDPCHPRCKGLMILETYTSEEKIELPDFLTVHGEVTDQPLYSMFNLSLKEYHSLEVRAGATKTTSDEVFNYRKTYAEEASNGGDSGIEMR